MTERQGSKSEREPEDTAPEEYRSDSTTSTGPEDTTVSATAAEQDRSERERRERGFGTGNRSQ